MSGRARVAGVAVLAAGAALLLLASAGGPDYTGYIAWSQALADGDLERLDGTWRSPLGLPLTQWSHGPGLAFALRAWLPAAGAFAGGWLAPAGDFRLIGWVAALALWVSVWHVARRRPAGDGDLAPATCALLFVGTPLGYYSIFHASESLSFGLLATAGAWTLLVRRPGWWDVVSVASLCAGLILVRVQLVLYVPVVLALLLHRLFESRSPVRARPWRLALALALPLALAVAQVGWVNRWMTGSPLSSSYVFGSSTFRSLDFARPELSAVLVHPWHGLLVYHPLFALAFAALAAGLVNRRGAQRRLYAGVALCVAAHVYLQAAWYCWWLGTGTFGMRGLGPAAIPLGWVALHELERLRREGRRWRPWLAAAVAASIWSWLLMVQGHTNFVTAGELFAAQLATLGRSDVWMPLAGSGALAWLHFAFAAESDRWPRAAAALLLGLAADFLVVAVCARNDLAASGAAAIAARILAVTAAGLALPGPGAPASVHASSGFRAWRPLPAALLIASTLLFGRLAFSTERRIFDPGPVKPGFVGAVDLREVAESLDEYRRVPGFEDKKRALEAYVAAGRRQDGSRP